MIRSYVLKNGHLVESFKIPTVLFVIKPNYQECESLIEMGIDEHLITSAQDPDELARIDIGVDDNWLAMIFKMTKSHNPEKPFEFEVSSLGIIIFRDKLLFISAEPLDEFSNLRIKSHLELVLKILSKIVVHFREHLRAIRMISDELQKEINTSMGNKHLISMFSIQKSLVYYLDSINSNGSLLERIKPYTSKLNFDALESELLEHIIIENAQCYKQAEIYSSILASLMDARASIISNNINVLFKYPTHKGWGLLKQP